MTTPENNEELGRPAVQVHIPSVKLRLQDLAFLRSISQPKAVRCLVSSSVRDRLQFLDLIARAKVPVSKEVVEKVKTEVLALRASLKSALKGQDWNGVGNIAYRLRQLSSSLAPTEDDVLTEKGKALLRQGEVTVRVRKVGCAK